MLRNERSRLLQVANSAVLSEPDSNAEKRESLIQVNRKPKRVKLSIDREHAVEGQTKLCWSELDENNSGFQSRYFKSKSGVESINEYDKTTY